MQLVFGVRGVITWADVVRNLPLIWREFGARCALRCIVAVITLRQTTFLQLVK